MKISQIVATANVGGGERIGARNPKVSMLDLAAFLQFIGVGET